MCAPLPSSFFWVKLGESTAQAGGVRLPVLLMCRSSSMLATSAFTSSINASLTYISGVGLLEATTPLPPSPLSVPT